jgi:hypothetical protein
MPSKEHEKAVIRLKNAGATVGGFSKWWYERTHEQCEMNPDAWQWDPETETLTVFEVTKTSGIAPKLPTYVRMWWVADGCGFELRLIETSAFGEGFIVIDLWERVWEDLPSPEKKTN